MAVSLQAVATAPAGTNTPVPPGPLHVCEIEHVQVLRCQPCWPNTSLQAERSWHKSTYSYYIPVCLNAHLHKCHRKGHNIHHILHPAQHTERRATAGLRTCTTTMLPTAAAACAARGEGGSPMGVILTHVPVRMSKM
jgi:hypothetical protein